ncbi:MAG: hypothetical protein WC683_16800 [bacterium]
MLRVVLAAEKLTHRPNLLQKLLGRLRSAGKQPVLAVQFVKQKADGGRAIAAHEGNASTTDYRDWRFRTAARDVWGQYFEIWKPLGSRQDEWYLHQAYLHLFRTEMPSHSLIEFLALHSDPNDETDEPVGSYKRGPHLHVTQSSEPLPHCHFPLNLGQLDQVLSSVDDLTLALESAIGVIAHDVLGRFGY